MHNLSSQQSFFVFVLHKYNNENGHFVDWYRRSIHVIAVLWDRRYLNWIGRMGGWENRYIAYMECKNQGIRIYPRTTSNPRQFLLYHAASWIILISLSNESYGVCIWPTGLKLSKARVEQGPDLHATLIIPQVEATTIGNSDKWVGLIMQSRNH